MNIIAVDDERHALDALMDSIRQAEPKCAPDGFRTPEDALAHARDCRVDVAFLDVELGTLNGLETARRLKALHAATNIVFVTAYSDYAVDAFGLSASGYLLKPVTPKAVRHALGDLRRPVEAPGAEVRIKTFGNFDIYVGGQPVVFSLNRAKEILAYLVDRQGGGVNKRELAAILWEDGEYSRARQYHLQTLISSLLASLRAVGAEDIIIRRRNYYAIDTKKVDCDYFRFNSWDVQAINAYHGEYMKNYSWAEFTAGTLETQVKRLVDIT